MARSTTGRPCSPCPGVFSSLPCRLCGWDWTSASNEPDAPRSGGCFFSGTLTIAWESVLITAVVPEHAYQGQNLLFRSINLFHPWDAWFSKRTQVPFSSIGLWLAGIGIVVAVLRGALRDGRKRPSQPPSLRVIHLRPHSKFH